MTLKGKGMYDDNKSDLLFQWSPNVQANLKNGHIRISDLEYPIEIQSIAFDFSPEKLIIDKIQCTIGESKFALSGEITHMDQYLNKTGLLVGDLSFASEHTNIDQIMDMVSGFGASDSALALEETENKEDDPLCFSGYRY